jgi:hypothetical protein
MGRSVLGRVVSVVLLLVFPASLLAADSAADPAAMLYTTGSAWVNGAGIPRTSSAIFSGDLLQTRSDTVANINSTGSSITVHTDSLVKFEGSSLNIEHGGVTVSTSKNVAAVAGDVKVAPATESWTEFNVTDLDGMVRIAARKGDVIITDGNEMLTLAQGQETTRNDSSDQANGNDSSKDKDKKNKKRASGAPPAAGGGILNSPVAVGLGAGAIAGVSIWVLSRNPAPASPSDP